MASSTMTIRTATVVSNLRLCREHHRLTVRLTILGKATPGQFIHLSPPPRLVSGYRTLRYGQEPASAEWLTESQSPMLRRAFSIAGLCRSGEGVSVEVIYRVVGTATRWLASLQPDDQVSVLGPLGNAFPIDMHKPFAWLVAGGVGLPPMLWLAEALSATGRKTVAFCGAQSRDLLPLTLDSGAPPATDARRATLSAAEFTRHKVPVVISTDDGSLGFPGHIGQALTAYHENTPPPPEDLVVYTCGPERMIRFVAEFCITRGIECHVCMERAMACGIGTCQSCVVPLRDADDPEGWRYQLCCTDGPVFAAEDVIWDPVGKGSIGKT